MIPSRESTSRATGKGVIDWGCSRDVHGRRIRATHRAIARRSTGRKWGFCDGKSRPIGHGGENAGDAASAAPKRIKNDCAEPVEYPPQLS